MKKSRRAFYGRTSTEGQNAAHQEIMAEAEGFEFDRVFIDAGVSGVKVPFQERPQASRLFDYLGEGDELIVRAIDRLGRNAADVGDTMRAFLAKGITIKTVIGKLVFKAGSDISTMERMQNELFIVLLSHFAQIEVEARSAAQAAGIKWAKENQPQKYRGKAPSFDAEKLAEVRRMIAEEMPMAHIAKATGLQRGTVYRIKGEPGWADELVRKWGRG